MLNSYVITCTDKKAAEAQCERRTLRTLKEYSISIDSRSLSNVIISSENSSIFVKLPWTPSSWRKTATNNDKTETKQNATQLHARTRHNITLLLHIKAHLPCNITAIIKSVLSSEQFQTGNLSATTTFLQISSFIKAGYDRRWASTMQSLTTSKTKWPNELRLRKSTVTFVLTP